MFLKSTVSLTSQLQGTLFGRPNKLTQVCYWCLLCKKIKPKALNRACVELYHLVPSYISIIMNPITIQKTPLSVLHSPAYHTQLLLCVSLFTLSFPGNAPFVSLDCYNRTVYTEWVINTTNIISHSSRGWEVQDQGAGRFHVWLGVAWWTIDDSVFT